ncbi:DUF423 domain-containing protein [Flavimarina sp. Hel_I_48]|uniref:DUF423 domain-containing protein n=1 Tax=Flavimarina sp. Hel_I_48 TaxID=1392488 RepID=UPI0004DFCB78|nr:DUF423 domain-containing protein [Flavimarina sp. Hel_I_48]
MGILETQLIACLFGFTAIIIGAFGAHALKKKFTSQQMESFETGVKYQMYHALLLLVLGYNLGFTTSIQRTIPLLITVGVVLFSFSIYGLCLGGASGKKWKWLGPVTPLGGLSLAAGWGLLFYDFIKNMI